MLQSGYAGYGDTIADSLLLSTLMLVFHGTWLSSATNSTLSGGLVLWGECTPELRVKRWGKRPKVSPHPFATDADSLDQALRDLRAGNAPRSPEPVLVTMPSRSERPLPSPELPVEVEDEADIEPALAP